MSRLVLMPLLGALALGGCGSAAIGETPTASVAQRQTVSKPQTYRYWGFAPGKKGTVVTRRAFEGIVLVPNTSELLAKVKTSRDAHGNVSSGWMTNGTSIQSIVTDPKGASVNILAVAADGSISSSVDLDGDQVADVVDILTTEGTRHVFATEPLGVDFYAAWRRGLDPFCFEKNGIAGLEGFAGFGCPDTSESSSGGGAAGSVPQRRGSLDPFDALCAGYEGGGRKGFEAPVMAYGGSHGREIDRGSRRDDATGRTIDVWAHVVYRDDAGRVISSQRTTAEFDADGNRVRTIDERVNGEGRGTRTTTEHHRDGTSTTTTEEITAELNERGTFQQTNPPRDSGSGSGESSSSGGGASGDGTGSTGRDGSEVEPIQSTPSPGPSASGDDWEAAFAEWCKRRAEDNPSGAEQVADSDPTDYAPECDPVVNPAMSAEERDKCGLPPEPERADIDGALAAGSPVSTCGPYAQPGPDGTCGPANRLDQLRGFNAFLGLASFPGIEVCNPIVCDSDF